HEVDGFVGDDVTAGTVGSAEPLVLRRPPRAVVAGERLEGRVGVRKHHDPPWATSLVPGVRDDGNGGRSPLQGLERGAVTRRARVALAGPRGAPRQIAE